MKRKLLLLSVLAICVATLAAGTLAYFSADGTARNVITTGNVSIAVEEWADADKTQPFEDLTGIMPGTTVQNCRGPQHRRGRRMDPCPPHRRHPPHRRRHAGSLAGKA